MNYKRIALSLMTTIILVNSNSAFSVSMKTINPEPNWSGFYLGGNAGYWWSQSDQITTTSSSSFINQAFSSGASSITSGLEQLATNNFSINSNGFIGGGQVGYNYQYNKKILLGLNTDLDGLTNSDNTYSSNKIVNLVDFSEEYAGSLAIKQRINYLGTVRARIGYLYNPTFLVYGTGGFTYGSVTVNTAWTANESLGSTIYPAIATQNNLSKVLTGWTAGGGIEWLFKQVWSANIEYTYYDLNNLNSSDILSQTNNSVSPPTLWGSTVANTTLPVLVGAIRVGLNYHFS
jgi:outer membrane immunogenic protein